MGLISKKDLDNHIAALVGPSLVENWWDSPNKHWSGFTPREIYEKNDEGKKEVQDYILGFCYGGW